MGRQSSIARLPPEAREALNAWLRDPSITQEEATGRVNDLLAELGLAEHQVSRRAVGRYDVKMRDIGKRLQQSREVAEMWIGRLGAMPQGKLGNLMTEMMRTHAFDLQLKLQEGEIDEESLPRTVKMLKELSLAVVRLERATSENVKREQQIREQARAEAAEAAERVAKQGGMSDAGAAEIRAAILGIKE